MKQILFTADSEDDTERLGKALAEVLPESATVALCGTLGAGKTRLVQAVAASCGIDRGEVISPTFVLCREYHGWRTLYHLDAYRIASDDEFLELGVDDLYDQPGIILIEWADRVVDCLPKERLEIQAQVTGQSSREFVIIAHGKKYETMIDSLSKKITENL